MVLAVAIAAGLLAAVPSQEAGPAAVEVASLDGFQLPPKTVFDPAMPRYPNVWVFS